MRSFFVLAACVLISGIVLAQPVPPVLYSCSSRDDQLRTIDPTTGGTINSIGMTIVGGTVDSCTGLATDPQTQSLYAIIKFTDDSTSGFDPGLAIINPATGAATVVGNFNTGFAGIAFSCTGLYGVTGDGGSPSETLFTVSTTDASVTQVLALGKGDDGETIGFNPVDGYMYHASGHDEVCDTSYDGVCFESIDLNTLTLTDIDISSGALPDEEAQALTWWADQGVFLWKQDHGTGPLFRVTTGGAETLIGNMDHQAKGLAFVPVNFPASCGLATPVPTNNKWALAALFGLILLLTMGYVRKQKARAA